MDSDLSASTIQVVNHFPQVVTNLAGALQKEGKC